MPLPSVSIVVPAFNAVAHLAGCVDALVAQDGQDIEIVVVNDGSTDETASMLERMAEREPRLRIVTHADGSNHGVAATRNRGLTMASGEFVWFVDADDRLRPGAIGTLLAAARSSQADVVAFNAVETGAGLPDTPIYRQAKPTAPVSGEEWLALCCRQKESRHYVWQRFYRRGYLNAIDAQFRAGIVHEDIAWITETDLRASRFAYVDAVMYDYVRNPQSLTRTASDAALLHRARSLMQVTEQLKDINTRCPMQDSTRRLLQAERVGQGVQVDYLRQRLAAPAARTLLKRALAEQRYWRGLWADAVTLTRKRQLARIMLREWLTS